MRAPEPYGCTALSVADWSKTLVTLDALSFEETYAVRNVGYFACGNACAATGSCKSWMYCNDRKGCSSGCQDYVNTHSNTRIEQEKLFGPRHQCLGDKWPYQMCALSTDPLPAGYPIGPTGTRKYRDTPCMHMTLCMQACILCKTGIRSAAPKCMVVCL